MLVRCLKLLKPYSQKGVPDDDDDDDEDEEDDSGTRRRAYPACGRLMEKDVLSQAYHIGAFHQSLLSTYCRVRQLKWIEFKRLHVGSEPGQSPPDSLGQTTKEP